MHLILVVLAGQELTLLLPPFAYIPLTASITPPPGWQPSVAICYFPFSIFHLLFAISHLPCIICSGEMK